MYVICWVWFRFFDDSSQSMTFWNSMKTISRIIPIKSEPIFFFNFSDFVGKRRWNEKKICVDYFIHFICKIYAEVLIFSCIRFQCVFVCWIRVGHKDIFGCTDGSWKMDVFFLNQSIVRLNKMWLNFVNSAVSQRTLNNFDWTGFFSSNVTLKCADRYLFRKNSSIFSIVMCIKSLHTPKKRKKWHYVK